MSILVDLPAERTTLAGMINDVDVFFDVEPILQDDTYTDQTNQVVFKCIKAAYHDNENSKIDLPLIRSYAHKLGFSQLIENDEEIKYIKGLLCFPTHSINVPRYAAIIRKLQITRLIKDRLNFLADTELVKINGTESIDHILSLVENEVFDFTSLLLGTAEEKGIVHISDGLDDYFTYLCDHPCDLVGLSTGFPIIDQYIGGLRRKNVTVLGARTGVGKSMVSDNIALHVAGVLKLPTLYLDTEMDVEAHWNRLMANISGVPTKLIENGKFSLNDLTKTEVRRAKDYLKSIPYFYKNISGKPFEETLSYARRWVRQHVGKDDNGRTKDCGLIYDYLKLMNSNQLGSDLQEHQVLGFQMTGLHNFTVLNDLPCFSSVQLNRDGITVEGLEALAQSDRIGWMASNVILLKWKDDNEMTASESHGNMKAIIAKDRYGATMRQNEYINIFFDGAIARIREGELSSTIKKPKKKKSEKFEIEENDNCHETVSFGGESK